MIMAGPLAMLELYSAVWRFHSQRAAIAPERPRERAGEYVFSRRRRVVGEVFPEKESLLRTSVM